ncbi:hypothetical protein NliqN6_4839 [Naganishia liquefaciens]|uniref:Pseudouridine synthase I TruA alpha/beta domain-containing protein n=1 Tax=Naganishia liquefaciens TaxID=104408 RepID=A0A8H3YHQ7_9TREE|nr:hypothetical protein NliqN6_4839 [Naganishia liquefaciens]
MAQSLHALSKQELIARLTAAEAKLGGSSDDKKLINTSQSTPVSATTPPVPPRAAQFHRNPTRKIALLFTYQGWHYSGLALQNLPTPLPTVEGELLAALETTFLVERGAGLEGCGFSRCGRTDRGVSSAGQVVTLWVRSKRKLGDGGEALGDDWREAREKEKPKVEPVPVETLEEAVEAGDVGKDSNSADATASSPRKRNRRLRPIPPSASQPYELAYPQMLNRVLPPEIRIIGWSPLPTRPGPKDGGEEEEFDARFSCQTRHYRYFFNHQPIVGQRPLDLGAMRAAAERLVGEHDFRNFCKVDGSKQIDNHCRRVISAVIRRDTEGAEAGDEEAPAGDYVFELIGSAFLWHQVRHIMAILFLVGHGLEQPSIVTRLLNTGYEPPPYPSGPARDVMLRVPLDPLRLEQDNVTDLLPNKPLYSMASGLPLQLYKCTYREGDVDWRYGSYDGPLASRRSNAANNPLSPLERAAATEGTTTLLQLLKNQVEEAKIQARHIQSFYDQVIEINHPQEDGGVPLDEPTKLAQAHTLGAGDVMACKRYVPLMQRARSESVEEINRKWMIKGGEKRRLKREAGAAARDAGSDGE